MGIQVAEQQWECEASECGQLLRGAVGEARRWAGATLLPVAARAFVPMGLLVLLWPPDSLKQSEAAAEREAEAAGEDVRRQGEVWGGP